MKIPFLLSALLLLPSAANAQQAASKPAPGVQFSVVVTENNGKAVEGLTEQDFAITDNKRASDIVAFHAPSPDSPHQLILVVDAVNTNGSTIALVQQQIVSFLSHAETLPEPVSVAYFADTGFAPKEEKGSIPSKTITFPDSKAFLHILGPSTDAKALLGPVTAMGPVLPNSGQMGVHGGEERVLLSVHAIYAMVRNELHDPGTKALVWISPGWPLLPNEDARAQPGVFDSVVAFASAFNLAQTTLYNIDPSPIGNGGNVFRTNTVSVQMGNMAVHQSTETDADPQHLYQAYLKPVGSAKQARFNHLALQVLAIKSGGQVFSNQINMSKAIAECIADSNSTYQLTIAAPKVQGPNEFHEIDIKMRKRGGLNVHALAGYYAQP